MVRTDLHGPVIVVDGLQSLGEEPADQTFPFAVVSFAREAIGVEERHQTRDSIIPQSNNIGVDDRSNVLESSKKVSREGSAPVGKIRQHEETCMVSSFISASYIRARMA